MKKQCNFRLPVDALEQLGALAVLWGMTHGDVVARLVRAAAEADPRVAEMLRLVAGGR